MKLYVIYLSKEYPRTPTKVRGGPRWEKHIDAKARELEKDLSENFYKVIREDNSTEIKARDEMAPAYESLIKYQVLDKLNELDKLTKIVNSYDRIMSNRGPEIIPIDV